MTEKRELAETEAGAEGSKKLKETVIEKDDEGNSVFELGGKKKVTISKFKGKTYINIREYYSKDGKDLPGKKGIALNLETWKALKQNMEGIDKAIEENEK